MKYKKEFVILSIFMLLAFPVSVNSQSQNGPESDTLYMKMFPNSHLEWLALMSGAIDVKSWPLSKSEYDTWASWPLRQGTTNTRVNPANGIGITLEETRDLGIFEFDMNNNETVDGLPGATYTQPGEPNPFADVEFKRAIAMLVDKVSIAQKDFGGLLQVRDVPLALPFHEDYFVPSIIGEGYPFKYNPNNAIAALDAAGYVQGTTDNPDFDHSIPWSAAKIRINPRTNKDIKELIFYVPDGLPSLKDAAERFAGTLRKVGIPVKLVVVGIRVVMEQVQEALAYHIVALYKMLPIKPTHLTRWFGFDGTESWNLGYGIFTVNAGPISLDTQLETSLKEIDAAASLSVHIMKVKEWQTDWYLGGKARIPIIPLGQMVPKYTVYLEGRRGVVNGEGKGVLNRYSFFLEYDLATKTFRGGLSVPLRSNVVTSRDEDAREIWDAQYDRLIETDPYYGINEMPLGLADWWEVDTWDGGTKSKFTFHIRGADGDGVSDLIKWHNGVPLTLDDVVFSLTYHKAAFGRYYNSVMYINETLTTVDNVAGTVIVYLDVLSYPAVSMIGDVPIIERSIWQYVAPWDVYGYDPLTTDANGNGVTDIFEDGTGPYKFQEMVTDDHVTLTADWDSGTAGRQNSYFLTTGFQGDINRFVKESFHRRGDIDYDGYVFTADLTLMSMSLSNTPYNTIGSATWQLTSTPYGKIHWQDDQYPKMIHGNWTNTNPAPGPPSAFFDNTGPRSAFDNTGLKWTGSAWVSFTGWTGDPYKAEDVNYDLSVNIKDLAVLAKNWKQRAGWS